MEYKGKLFGKVGKQYFPLLETTEDVDNLKKQNKELIECLKQIKLISDNTNQHPDFINIWNLCDLQIQKHESINTKL